MPLWCMACCDGACHYGTWHAVMVHVTMVHLAMQGSESLALREATHEVLATWAAAATHTALRQSWRQHTGQGRVGQGRAVRTAEGG